MKKIFLMLVLGILLISCASALELMNTKSYNAENKTISIQSTFLWIFPTGKVADIKLDTPLVYNVIRGKDRLVAEFTINNYETYSESVFDKMQFLDMKKGNKEIDKKFVYKYQAKIGIKDVPYYKQNCEISVKNSSQSCKNEIAGYNKENIYEWKEFSKDELSYFPRGEIKVGIFTDVEADEKIEWIPTFYGVKINDWAVWEESLTNGLIHWWEPNSTLNKVVDLIGINNGSLVGDASIKAGVTPDGRDAVQVVSTGYVNVGIVADCPSGTEDFTILMGINYTRNPAYGTPFSQGTEEKFVMFIDGSGNTYGELEGQGTYSTIATPLNQFVNVVWMKNATGQYYWVGGVSAGSSVPVTKLIVTHGNSTYFGRGVSGTQNLNGQIYKYALWNRALNESDILYLNDTYYAPAPSDATPTIALISPANNTNFSSDYVVFNCTASDDRRINNISFWINGQRNYTINGGSNYTEINFSRNLGEGKYNWTCSADDNSTTTQTGWGANRTLIVDLVFPEVNILAPANNSVLFVNSIPYNVSLNVSVSDAFGFTNCWWFNSTGTQNISVTCGANVSVNLTEGSHIFRYYANDSVGHITENSTEFYINYYNSTGAEYQNVTLEETNNTIYFNFSATNLSSASANITYNGTTYVMIGSSNGTFVRFAVNVTSPAVTATQPINFSITLLSNGITLVFGNYSQIIYNVEGVTFASSCSDRAYNFTFRDEQNFTILNGTMEYNLKWGTIANNTKYSSYGKIEDINSFYLCINSSIPSNWSVGEGEIFYRSDGYVDRRYYIYSGSILTNKTINITLFDLASVIQTSFKIEIESTSLSPYSNKYVSLIRWYPDLNQYNIVDMGKTDEKGESVIHVRTEDVDYRIGVNELNGDLIKLANPIRMVCLVTPCTYTLQISPTEEDFTNFLNVQYTLDYNATSGIWTYIWTDTSQTTSSMNLTIWKLGGSDVYPVCSNLVTGASGAITCNTSIYLASENTLEGRVERSASPPVPITAKVITTKILVFASKWGLFLSLIIGIPIIFIFAFMSPIGAIIGGVIGLIPALYFGSINWAILGGIAVLAGIVIHFLKRVS